MEETGDGMEDDATFTSPFSSNEISKEERQLKAKTIFQREFDKQLDELEKQITRHESSITLVKKYLNIIRCQLLLRGDGDDKFIFGAGTYPFVNTRKRAEKQNEKNKSSSTGNQSEHIPHIKVDSSCGNNGRAQEAEVNSTLFKNNNKIPRKLHQDSECHIRGKRFKKLQRFVVGNVSQWCPERQYQVSAPYKWMLYVRGPREDADISKYVTKVSVFLDPSYYPNNVVHIKEPPFHLVRRGWGEFLVRIVIFFYLSRNKPLTIYHRLRLDRTQCGYQRGAPETIADYWIYTDIPRNTINVNSVVQLGYKEENVTIKEDKYDVTRLQESCSKESDHCIKKDSVSVINMHQTTCMSVTDLMRLIDGIVTEHNYSRLHKPEQRIQNKPSQQVLLVKNPFKILIEGKSGVSVLKTSVKRSASVGTTKKRRILTKRSYEVKHDELFRLAAEKSNTLPYHQAVSFLLHRLPLVTYKAASQDYLRFHPYAAKSVDQYHSWSMARQCAAQYYRSKMIKNALVGRGSSDESWTCKEIVIYARRHGYVPFPKLKLVQDGCKKKYVKISANDSMFYKSSSKPKTYQRNKAEKDTSVLIDNKPEHGSKVKKNKMSLVKNKDYNSTDIRKITATETIKREASPVNKDYTPSARLKNIPASEFMTNDASKICKSKKKRSETQLNKDSVVQNLRRVSMKPTLCEPKSILEFISANDEEYDDPSDVDILSLYNTVDVEDSLSEDILEVDKERAQLCHFVRKSFKWLSLQHGPKPNHYTVPEILVAVAAELFMEDIFRRTLYVAWNHYNPKGKTPITIFLKDALVALRRRKQFDIFSNCGLGIVCKTRQVDK